MEKKKLVLVTVSVGVFLAIAISAAILISSQKAQPTAAAAVRPISPGLPYSPPAPPPADVPGQGGDASRPASLDAVDMVRNADGIQGIQAPPQATAIQENNFYINGERAEDSYRIETDGGQGRVMINVPRPTTAAVPDAPAVPEKPELQAAAPPQRAAARPAAPRPAAGASAPARPAPARPVRSDYWVQTGAFSAKVRAEGARETLAGKGIASIIENRVVDGKTWYRVRVGPYTSENEANYWLSLVKTIDGFADSQVRLTPSR